MHRDGKTYRYGSNDAAWQARDERKETTIQAKVRELAGKYGLSVRFDGVTMKSRAANLALFRSLTGKTTISPVKVSEDVVKLTGYQPSKVVAYRTWRR